MEAARYTATQPMQKKTRFPFPALLGLTPLGGGPFLAPFFESLFDAKKGPQMSCFATGVFAKKRPVLQPQAFFAKTGRSRKGHEKELKMSSK